MTTFNSIPVTAGKTVVGVSVGSGHNGHNGQVTFTYETKKPKEYRTIDEDFMVSCEPKWE